MAPAAALPYFSEVSFFLRLLGITNAALWFGSTFCLALAVAPAFSSEAMLKILPRSHSGAAAQVIWEQYFVLQFWFAGVAVVHLLVETLYAGKRWKRRAISLLAGLVALSVFSGMFAGPVLKRSHLETYGVRSTPQQRELAKRTFKLWSNLQQVSTLLLIFGLWGYVWEVNRTEEGTRFVGAAKVRG